MKKILLSIASVVIVILGCSGLYIAWLFQQIDKSTQVIQCDPHLTIYLEGGCNSVVLTSLDGSKALIVDTKMMNSAKKLRDYIKAADITIINTHFHMDHIGGNRLYTNAVIIAGNYTRDQWDAEIVKQGGYPNRLIKIGKEIIIPFDDEKVHVRNMGLAHSWNDVVVYFEKRKLLTTGDLVFNRLHPVLPSGGSCSVISWVRVLDDLEKRYDIKMLVPGHGKLSDKKAIADMKEYFVSIGNSIGDPAKQKELKVKYRDYFSIPVIMNFANTLAFIEKEKNEGKGDRH